MLTGSVDPAFSGALFALFRNDASGVRFEPERNRKHLIGRRHLEIERNAERMDKSFDVGVGDVTPILAQMGGNSVCARSLRQFGSAHWIRISAAARLTHRRHVVDVHA
jgi:hypothetical protein